MSRRLVSIALTMSLILGMSTVALGATQPKPSVAINATTVVLENDAYINELGQLMYPLRQLAKQLDYSITWNEKNSSIVVSGESDVIELKIGEPNITVNGKNIKMGSSPIMKEGTTFVPVEFFSNALDLIVGWDNKQQTLQINQPKENTEDYFTISEGTRIQDELDTYMKALQKYENFHGSILVAKGGKLLINEGYGFADFHQNTNNKSQTKFAVGSVTKQFTAMAIMQLNEKGLINVEDKISKYIVDFPNGDLITIHNLLTHTSGLKNYTELNEFWIGNSENKSPMAMVNLIKDMPLEFQPGKEFRYSNTNYLLLGIIVEKITGMSLEDYLQKNIFDPLNMRDTGVSYGENNESYDATAYTGYLEVLPVEDEVLLAKAYGAGNMYSTVEDLYRWDRALEAEQLVKKSTIDEIFKEHIAIPGLGAYGYGWMIGDSPIGKQIFHGGNTLGFTANIVRYVDEDMTIIILTNSGAYDVNTLANTLMSITHGKEYKMPMALTEIKISNPDLYDSYVGEYELAPGVIISILKEGNQLFAKLTGQDKYEIFPMSESEYFYKIVDAKISFTRDEDGQVINLVLHQNGQDMPAFKIK